MLKKILVERRKTFFHNILRHVIVTTSMHIFKNIYFIFNTYQLLPKLQNIDIKICVYKQVVPVNCLFSTLLF